LQPFRHRPSMSVNRGMARAWPIGPFCCSCACP
jgi:hypothetical protein